MKLLYDANLSDKLARRLAEFYPDSAHVSAVGLNRATDEEVWEHARAHGLAIVSKDSDFQELSVLKGHPPKVVWIRRRNCSTQVIADLLRANRALLESFDADDNLSLLMLL